MVEQKTVCICPNCKKRFYLVDSVLKIEEVKDRRENGTN